MRLTALFSLSQTNVSYALSEAKVPKGNADPLIYRDDAAFKSYLKQAWIPDASDADLDAVVSAYPDGQQDQKLIII